MTSRRLTIALLLSTLLSDANDFARLAARWRFRMTVVRHGRPIYTRLRLTFSATGGQLVWIYKGAARFTADGELYLDVATVTDSNGATPESARARYEPGESYNLGAVAYISAARVRVGALELRKELD